VDVTDPTSFVIGRGLREGGDYQSFPSGHATAAFAFASAVTAQATVGHPGRRWSVGLPLYAVAAGTAWARIHDNRHWASDVVGGAAVGTVAGLATVRFHRARPGGRLDRWFLAVHVTPAAGGGNGVRLSILPR
jgi:membrane-associated phospholipid phosphatase